MEVPKQHKLQINEQGIALQEINNRRFNQDIT